MIQLCNLNRLYKELEPNLTRMADLSLKSGRVMLGEFTQEFEERIARVAGADHAVVVGSGSDALYYGLVASGIKGPVALPSQTFIATENSIYRAGLNPVCVDVKPNGLLDWDTVPHGIDRVVWVGLFGNTETIPTDVMVIEDGAQHFGAPLQGKLAAYSFDPTKALPNFGNGGAVVTNDKHIADRVRDLRRHGHHERHVGGNSIMSERDCAELLVKLEHFPFWQERRQEIAYDYTMQLGNYVDIVTDCDGLVSKFVIGTEHRGELADHLYVSGIETKSVYQQPIWNLPGACNNCNRHLALPCDPYTTDQELLHIIRSVKEFFQELPLAS